MTGDETPGAGDRIARRRFLAAGAGAAVSGFPIPFLSRLPAGVTPLALAADISDPNVAAFAASKPGLSMISDRPLNLETPPHLLDDAVTPAARMFVRNNGHVQEVTPEAAAAWTLTIDGAVENPLTLTIEELKRAFETTKLQLQIEVRRQRPPFHETGDARRTIDFRRRELRAVVGRSPCRHSPSRAAARLCDLHRA